MQNLDKSQASTISEITFDSLGSDNEAKLIKIIRNLQLQLGYHGIALRKAERMINLLQTQNQNLKVQNQQLVIKCESLEFQLTKFQIEFNKIGLKGTSSKILSNTSDEAKQNKIFFNDNQIYLNAKVKQNKLKEAKTRPKSQAQDDTSVSHHSNGRLSIKNNNLFGSNETISKKNIRQSNKVIQHKTNQISFNENFKQGKKQSIKSKSPSRSPLKSTVQTLSFIPFDQLSIKTRWS